MQQLKLIIPAIILMILLFGCAKEDIPVLDGYLPVTISAMKSAPADYIGTNIAVEGYVLGGELMKDSKVGHIWIMVLGDKPVAESVPNQLIFPDIENKIRVGEAGFNQDIMTRCHEICQKFRNSGHLIKVYGALLPSEPLGHYTGVDLHLRAVEIDGSIFDTDFSDHGRLHGRAPYLVKKLIKGGKGLAKLMKMAI